MAAKSSRTALYRLLVSDLLPVIRGCELPDEPDGPFDSPPVDAGIREFAAFQLAKSLVKKFEDEIDKDTADQAALEKFLAANDHCSKWQAPPWSLARDLCGTSSYSESYDAQLYGEFQRQMRNFFEVAPSDLGYAGASLAESYPSLDWGCLLDVPKICYFADVGPGASLGADGCSFVEKFDGELTFCGKHIPMFWQVKTTASSWAFLEISRLFRGMTPVEVDASSLHFVLKTVDESRAICIGPALNTFFQKGAQFLLELQLRLFWGIDLSNQQAVNRSMAHAGSLFDSFGTIDLRSASDTIAYAMVKANLPAHQFKFLDWLREPRTRIGDTSIELQMFSTMGNATTFPLMTAIFAAVVASVYRCRGIPLLSGARSVEARAGVTIDSLHADHIVVSGKPRNWAVNGDDIIVVPEAYDDVMRLLKILGFTPNATKSFNRGFFRESCGADFYKGTNVRGVYCKSLKTDQDINSLINRLTLWSAEHHIYLPNLCGWLAARLKTRLFVPLHEQEVSGIRVPLDYTRAKNSRMFKSRGWHGHSYQKWEPVPDQVNFPDVDWVEESSGCPTVVSEEGRVVVIAPPGQGFPWPFSGSATWLSLLKGELRGGVLTKRPRGPGFVRYRAVWCWTHSWDSVPLLGGPWKHGLAPLAEDYKRELTLALLRNRIIA